MAEATMHTVSGVRLQHSVSTAVETMACAATPRQAHEERTVPIPYPILLVEDDAALRTLLRIALTRYGYQVVTAATAQEADDALRGLGPTAIGLVISDINLTDTWEAREGYTLYQYWTTRHPTLPYLFISADTTHMALPAIRAGVVPFLAKPFSIRALLDTVHALLSTRTGV
jgi:DNA-binding NtrC family response regulator